jgi:iron complex outermembrane receptor protein
MTKSASACSLLMGACLIVPVVWGAPNGAEADSTDNAATTAEQASYAQPPQSGQSQASTLSEVVVTAERREENIQNVPIDVTALTGNDLTNMQVQGTDALANFAPTLNITHANIGAVPFLRGIGNFTSELGNEATVAIYVDGVYRPGASADQLTFNNIDRVEILNGPQGTLFGRNATGGVINIITKNPTKTPVLDAQVGYANYDTTSGNLYLAGGLTSNLVADLAVNLSDQGNGWGTNFFNGQDVYTNSQVSLRSKWIYTPTTVDTVTFLAYSDKIRSDEGMGQSIFPGTLSIVGTPHVGGFFDTDTNAPTHGHVINSGASAQYVHDFGDVNFISLTSYGNADWDGIIENDATAENLQQAGLNSIESTWQQELRLASAPGSRIAWTGGLYVFVDSAIENPNVFYGTIFTPDTATYPGNVKYIKDTQDTVSYAAYGQTTIPITDSTNLTLGARWTTDQRRYHGINYNSLGELTDETNGTLRQTKSDPTWRASVDHHFNNATMAYVSWSRGFKSGNFSSSNIDAAPTLPETLDLYELGLKTDLMNNTLRFDTSVFLYKFHDLLVLQFLDTGSNQTNAGAATDKGVDVSFVATPTANFSATLSGEYLDDYYTQYTNALLYQLNPNGEGYSTYVGNADGEPLQYVDPLTGTLQLRYLIHLGGAGTLALLGAESYHHGYRFDQQGYARQPAYTVTNTTLTWTNPSGRWDVQLWGANVFDARIYAQKQISPIGYTYSPGAPATYGIKVGYHWE